MQKTFHCGMSPQKAVQAIIHISSNESIPEVIQTILQHCLLMLQSPTFKSLLCIFGFQALTKIKDNTVVIVILARS